MNHIKNIIFVDDEKQILKSLKRVFYPMRKEWNVRLFSSTNEALIEVEKGETDVIFTDIQMPIMNGIELIEKIKSTYPMIRVIIGTGYINFKYGLAAFTNGAETILFKPYDLKKLEETIEKSFGFLDQWEIKLRELQELKKDKEKIPGGSETVLYVDDDEKTRNFSKFNLEKKGYEFLYAADGGEALQLAENNGAVDLLITSVKLKDMYGKDLYKKIKFGNTGLKVLYIVSYKENVIFEDNVLHEDDDYIYFPFTRKVLTKAVRRALDN